MYRDKIGLLHCATSLHVYLEQLCDWNVLRNVCKTSWLFGLLETFPKKENEITKEKASSGGISSDTFLFDKSIWSHAGRVSTPLFLFSSKSSSRNPPGESPFFLDQSARLHPSRYLFIAFLPYTTTLVRIV